MADELVLIVDDNEKNLKLARDVLRHAGFRTLEARTGGDGVSLAVEQLPDLVLMDIRLPDMDGTEAVAGSKRMSERLESRSSRSRPWRCRATASGSSRTASTTTSKSRSACATSATRSAAGCDDEARG